MKPIIKKIFRGLVKLLGVFFLLTIFWVILYKYTSPPITGMMLYKWTNVENYSIDYRWKPLNEINVAFPLAFIASEDQFFLKHNGFDVEAIKKAIRTNKTTKRIKGASTISQQVAKNVFLIPTKSYFRKGLEVYFTTLIELIWKKRRIMEVYLNIVELGEGVYGVEAACQNYFATTSSEVKKEQAATVAVTLPNPLIMKLTKPSLYMQKRSKWVIQQMKNLGGERILSEWYE